MKKLWAIIEALYVGKSLTNAAGWKTLQNSVNALITVIGAIVVFLPEQIHLSQDDVALIAKAIGTIGVAVNGYLTPATTEKIGIKSRNR